MATVQLRDAISDYFAIILDDSCFESHSTPNNLKMFALQNEGAPLEFSLPLLELSN